MPPRLLRVTPDQGTRPNDTALDLAQLGNDLKWRSRPLRSQISADIRAQLGLFPVIGSQVEMDRDRFGNRLLGESWGGRIAL